MRARRRCRACIHFRNDSATLERELRGLTSFGSAHASVRAEDGLCLKHDRYLSADRSCPAFAAHGGAPES